MHHVAVVTPPVGYVVSLVDAKRHLRVDHSDEDTLIEAYLAAAISRLDGPSGILNRALSTQVLEATIEGFPDEPLSLRCEPIQSVDDIAYIAADGAVTPIDDPDTYELTADGRLRPAYGESWPTPRSDEDPVTINYTAGYATLPPPLKAAILLMVGDLYANRETTIAGVSAEIPMSATVQRLIAPYRNLRA